MQISILYFKRSSVLMHDVSNDSAPPSMLLRNKYTIYNLLPLDLQRQDSYADIDNLILMKIKKEST